MLLLLVVAVEAPAKVAMRALRFQHRHPHVGFRWERVVWVLRATVTMNVSGHAVRAFVSAWKPQGAANKGERGIKGLGGRQEEEEEGSRGEGEGKENGRVCVSQ